MRNIKFKIHKNYIFFGLLYLFINIIWLLDLLPIMGFYIPINFSTRILFGMLFVFALYFILIKKKIKIHKISTLFLIFGLYGFLITIIYKDLQQQSFYYYTITILYPWIITYLTESLLCSINNVQIKKIFKVLSIFVILYSLYIYIYRMNSEYVPVASGESAVYYVVTLLPFILCCDKKQKYFYLLVITFTVLICFKRTALIALVIALLMYYAVCFYKNDKKKLKLLLQICFFVFCMIIIYELVVKYTGNDVIEKLFEIQKDGGSGRNEVYTLTLEKFKESNLAHQLFGIGFNGVRYTYDINIAGDILSAHNDFIEILVDYGILGLVFYIFFIVRIIKIFFILEKSNSFYAAPMASALVIYFVISMFSHLLLYPTYFINLLIFFVIMENEAKKIR